jgi:O-antigen/teichoic acid export membrane protein
VRQPFQGRRRIWTVVTYGAMSVQPKLTGAILGLLYASTFTLQEYGVYGVLTAVLVVLGILGDFGLPSAILRNYYDRHHDSAAACAYLSSVVYGSAVISLIALPLVGGALYLLWDLVGVGRSHIVIFIPMLLLTSFCVRSTEVLASICRAMERPMSFAAGRVAEGVVTLTAAFVIVFLLKGGLVGALLAALLGKMSASLVYHVVLFNDLGIGLGGFSWKEMRACLVFGLPLVPNRLATWSRQLALRPVLTHLVSMPSVGLFSFASSVASLPTVLSSAVDLALSPVYFKKRVRGSEAFVSRVVDFARIFVAILFPIWTAAVVFCPDIIVFFAGKRYAGAAPACAALLAAAFCRMQHPFLLRQVHFLRETWILPLVAIPCSALSILATILFTRTHGIVAAGWAVAFSDLVLFTALAGAIYHYEPVNYPVSMSLGLLSILVVLAVWVGLAEPLPMGWPRTGVKIVVVMLAAMTSGFAWIWPGRIFIRQLAAS